MLQSMLLHAARCLQQNIQKHETRGEFFIPYSLNTPQAFSYLQNTSLNVSKKKDFHLQVSHLVLSGDHHR